MLQNDQSLGHTGVILKRRGTGTQVHEFIARLGRRFEGREEGKNQAECPGAPPGHWVARRFASPSLNSQTPQKNMVEH